jgi:anti-sigma regulatory factor (Ser/Thr protein kinase)
VRLDGVASVAAARRFVRRTLATWRADDHEWAALTVATELATNAVLHAGTDYTVALALDEAGTLTIEVGDGSPLVPIMRRYDDEATTGRGVALIAELTSSWQVEHTAGGKVVRCELPAPADFAPRIGLVRDSEAAPAQRETATSDASSTDVRERDSA